MKIVFLDIDGVLNSMEWMRAEGKQGTDSTIGWNRVDPKACECLNRIVEATGAKVVISSTWRKILSLTAIREVLYKSGARVQIISKTPVLHKPRGIEVQAWIDERNKHYVDKVTSSKIAILDDDGDMEHLLPRLVQTNCEYGLQTEHVELTIKLLNEGDTGNKG